MDKRPLVKGRIANFCIFLDVFRFFKKIGFLGILGPLYCDIGATIRIGQEMLCLTYEEFFYTNMSEPKIL